MTDLKARSTFGKDADMTTAPAKPSIFAPAHDAPAAAVRDFFARLLVQNHGLDEAAAREIAGRWQFGRGSELRYYHVDTFRAMFGPEAGDLLFGYANGKLRSDMRGVVVGKAPGRGVEAGTDLFGFKPGSESLFFQFLPSLSFFLPSSFLPFPVFGSPEGQSWRADFYVQIRSSLCFLSLRSSWAMLGWLHSKIPARRGPRSCWRRCHSWALLSLTPLYTFERLDGWAVGSKVEGRGAEVWMT